MLWYFERIKVLALTKLKDPLFFAKKAHQFTTAGYCELPAILDDCQLEKLSKEASAALQYADSQSLKSSLNQWVPMLSKRYPLATTAFTSLLPVRLATAALRRPVFGVMCDVNRFSGHHDMHRDAMSIDLVGIRINVYLSPNHERLAFMEIRPGSHRRNGEGLINEERCLSNEMALAYTPKPGDGLAFDLQLLHGVPLKNSLRIHDQRTFISFFYYAVPRSESEWIAVRQSAARNRRAPAYFHGRSDPLYPKDAQTWMPKKWWNALVLGGFVDYG